MTRFNYLDVVSTLGLLSFDENGVLQGAYPGSPTRNDIRIAVDGVGSGYAMCAIDALGVPFFFSAKTVIESANRATNERMLITIDPASPDTDAYAEIVISVPKAMPTKKPGESLEPAADLCPLIGFFTSADSVPPDQHDLLNIIPFEDAFAHGRRIFNLARMTRDVKTLFGTLCGVYPAGSVSGDGLADALLADNDNPLVEALGAEQARKMMLNQITTKQLVQQISVVEGPDDHYELTSKGRAIVEVFLD